MPSFKTPGEQPAAPAVRPAIAPPLLQAKRFGVVWLAPWVSVYSVILPVAKPEKTR
jgi:hypothetical protein